MTIEELTKLWYALNVAFAETEAKELFTKLLRNITKIIL